jgi:predicted metal-dependent HD superfamily phosphohydrolase
MLIDNLAYASLEAEVIGRLRRDLSPDYRYHNAEHTLDVVEAAERIARLEGLGESDRLLVRTAALLHDTGYLEGRKEHELISQRIARNYLSKMGVDEDQIRAVERMIGATRVPQQPQDLFSRILCDADLDYLGRDDYFPLAERMYFEFLQDGTVRNEADWLELQVRFLGAHRYFTTAAKVAREAGLKRHLETLKGQLAGSRSATRA